MRNRLAWTVGLLSISIAIGATSGALTDPAEARPAVEIEDIKVELELAMTEGLVVEGGGCLLCFGHNCPWPGQCGSAGTSGCMCRTCGGSYNCFIKPGIPAPR